MTPYNMVPQRVPRQMHYTDGSPSREVEDDDDWEATGEEEMNKLHQGIAYKKPVSIIDLRDRIINTIALIDVARTALLADEHDPIKVCNVLFFGAILELERIEKELARI